MTENFWQGKKVFLTGHTGFKGSWLSLWLQSLNAQVTGFALEPATQPNLFELAHVAKGMQSIYGDIRDLQQISTALKKFQPDILIHMAAQPLVQHSYQFPVETYATNVMGTVHVLEAARYCDNLKVIINVTSDKCYENKEWDWSYRENENLCGYDPYSNSKSCAELVTTAYRNSYFNLNNFKQHGKALASVRAGNVIGGGDWNKNRLIPDIMNAFMRNEVAYIRNPFAIRPWQHVLDALSGYLLLIEKMWVEPEKFSQAWNFGPNETDVQPVHFIANKLQKLWGHNAKWIQDPQSMPHEAQTLKLDSAKAKNKLGWQPRLNIEQALDYVYSWYVNLPHNKNMQAFTLAQILNYQNINRQDARKEKDFV